MISCYPCESGLVLTRRLPVAVAIIIIITIITTAIFLACEYCGNIHASARTMTGSATALTVKSEAQQQQRRKQ